MILEIRMKNVYSYKDEFIYSMLAPNNIVKNRYSDNFINLNGYDILKTAVIVGENAGGKSNFINAIKYFQSLFNETSNITVAEVKTMFNNFDESAMDLLQEFSIIISASNGFIYKYELRLSVKGIEYESLSFSKGKGLVDKNIFTYSSIDGKVSISVPSNKDIEKIVSTKVNSKNSNGLIVNSLSLLGVDKTPEFVNEIKDIKIQKNMLDMPLGIQYQIKADELKPYLGIMKEKPFLEIFRMVDSSITGIEIDDDLPLIKSVIKRTDAKGNKIKRYIGLDSTGVKNFLVMSILIYEVVYKNSIIFNDEMDSTFNPILTNKVISFIHSSETQGQFIFTTHNIFNLSFQTFMKEQMFIVEKDKSNLSSKLYSLSNFNELRYDASDKIYEYYLKGVLGGVDNGF